MAAEPAHDAVFAFAYEDEPTARVVERSVRQEVGEIDGERTRATVTREDATVTVTVTASDLVALRAGVNTWTTLVSVAERCAGAEAGH